MVTVRTRWKRPGWPLAYCKDELQAAATENDMALVAIDAGVCGYATTVRATRGAGYSVRLDIESECPHVRKIDADIDDVNALQQIGLRDGLPPVLQTAYRHCAHAACPVPSGLIKAIEVAAGLALAKDVSIRVS